MLAAPTLATQAQKIHALVTRLIAVERVRPNDIVVLIADGPAKTNCPTPWCIYAPLVLHGLHSLRVKQKPPWRYRQDRFQTHCWHKHTTFKTKISITIDQGRVDAVQTWSVTPGG